MRHFQHVSTGSDPHRGTTVVRLCGGVPAGPVNLEVFARRRDGDEDCYRGYGGGLDTGSFNATIIIEEVQ